MIEVTYTYSAKCDGVNGKSCPQAIVNIYENADLSQFLASLGWTCDYGEVDSKVWCPACSEERFDERYPKQ